MFLRVIFFQKIFGAKKKIFSTSSNVGFVRREDNALRPCAHAVPQGLGRGPDSQYVAGGVNVPCHARKRTEQG